MSLAKLCLPVAFISLCACSKFSAKELPAVKTTPEGKAEEVATDYSESALLNLVETSTPLKSVEENNVVFKGTGSKSTYKIFYKFNSKSATSFKVLNTVLSSSYSDCSGPSEAMSLKGPNQNVKVDYINQFDITPNTDYVFEVEFKNPSCKDLEINFNVIAWVGFTSEDPSIAVVCGGQRLSTTTFFPQKNFLTTFSATPGNKKFLDMNLFCGEKFEGGVTACSSSLTTGIPEPGFFYSSVSCHAQRGDEERSFIANFDVSAKEATLVCHSNKKETFADAFQNCVATVMDFKAFDQ